MWNDWGGTDETLQESKHYGGHGQLVLSWERFIQLFIFNYYKYLRLFTNKYQYFFLFINQSLLFRYHLKIKSKFECSCKTVIVI